MFLEIAMEPSRVPMTQPWKLSNITSFSVCQSKLSHRASPDSRRKRGGSKCINTKRYTHQEAYLWRLAATTPLFYIPLPFGKVSDPLMFLHFLFYFLYFYLFVLLFGRLPQLSLPIIFLFSKISFFPDHSIFIAFFPCVVHMNSCLIAETTALQRIWKFPLVPCLVCFFQVPLVYLDVSCLCWGTSSKV